MVFCRKETPESKSSDLPEELVKKAPAPLSDEELASKAIRLGNTAFDRNDSLFYKAEVINSVKPEIKGVNLYGKTSRKGRLSYFENTLIFRSDEKVSSLLPGHLFRIDATAADSLFFFTYDNTRNLPRAYSAVTNNDRLEITEVANSPNFYFDLMANRQFSIDIPYPEKYFILHKSLKISSDSLLLELIDSTQSLYKTPEPFFERPTPLPIQTYLVKGREHISEVLAVHSADTVDTWFQLAEKKKTGDTLKITRSEFIDDNTLARQTTFEWPGIDNKHLTIYHTDSISQRFLYNKDFDISLVKSDSFKLKKNYYHFYQDLKDSIFIFETNPVATDGNEMIWRYQLRYLQKEDPSPNPVRVRVLKKQLMKGGGKLVFSMPETYLPKQVDIAEIVGSENHGLSKDLNFDGHPDLVLRAGSDLAGNPRYEVYLYNKQKGDFSRDTAFDGTAITEAGIISIPEHRRLLYSAVTANGGFSASLVKIDKTGNPESKTNFWTSGSPGNLKVNYQKTVRSKVTEKEFGIDAPGDWQMASLKNDFLNWVKAQLNTD